jgi:nucleoside-diphosphate-sugar epimerase
MEVIGRGFLGGYLIGAFANRYPDVTAIAAGVTRTQLDSFTDVDREAELVYGVVQRCRAQDRTVLFFSTASDGMYSGYGAPSREDGPIYPSTAYGRHKLALESVLAQSGAKWLTLRLSHVVGHGQQKHQLIPSLMAQIRSGNVIVYRDTYRDLLDVKHMIAALDCLLAKAITGQVVNVASGRPEHIDRIIDEIERRLAITARRQVVDGPARCTVACTARLREIMPGWDDFGFSHDYLPRLLDQYVGPVPPQGPRPSQLGEVP